jgi:ribosomal protein L13
VYKTYYPKADEIERKWFVVDANGENLGRLATRIAAVLLGKHKPTFTPGVEMGDYVIVVNAELIAVTGTKTTSKKDSKMYHNPFRCEISSQSIRIVSFELLCGGCCLITAWGVLCSNA